MTHSTVASGKLRPFSFFPAGGDLKFPIILMLIAFFCFASMDASAKWLVEAAIPSLQVAFMRYLVHFLWVMVIYLPKEGMTITRSNRPRQQIVRSLLLLGGTAFNFTALAYLPLTVTLAIFFAAPMVVSLMSIPVLGEKVGARRFAAIVFGFVGVLVIVQPWDASFEWPMLLSVAALLCASGYFVATRLIANADTNSVSQLYASGIPTLLLCPFVLMDWVLPSSPLAWILMLLTGTLGMLGHSVLTRAHQIAEASRLAPLIYSQIIYITLFSWLLFNEPPTWTTTIGTLIIVASGVYLWQRERIAKQI